MLDLRETLQYDTQRLLTVKAMIKLHSQILHPIKLNDAADSS